MKKFRAILCFVVLTLIYQVCIGAGSASAVDTDNFYFSSFTADYYLTKDAEGISHLRVVEQLTAEFPNYDQNKGIKRFIPFTNQNGTNITFPNSSQIGLLRNGEPEPVWDAYQEDAYYVVETGTDDYLRGTQVYTLSYEFEKVITDFGNHQELYWDTNGNDWPQRFDQLTARVHFDDEIYDAFTGENSCYVGKYGEKGMERCTKAFLDDGMMFEAEGLAPFENLTFEVEFKPGTFTVPEPEKSYAAIIVAGLICVVCAWILIRAIMKYQVIAKKIKKYKAMFVTPQYQPHPKYGLAEMAEVYLGKKKDLKVGVLLDLIVDKKVELKKKGDAGIDIKHKWALVVKDTNISTKSMIVLQILANKLIIKDGDVIELESRLPTRMLAELGRQFDRTLMDDLMREGLVDGKYKVGSAGSLNRLNGLWSVLIEMIVWMFFVVLFIIGFGVGNLFTRSIILGKEVVGIRPAVIVSIVVIAVTIVMTLWMSRRTKMIESITENGFVASRYMEGLKMYIKMAEADRMKVLQSVEGADITPEGIVKLYEELLPYAAVFGVEESWMDEMRGYCNAVEIVEPDYLTVGITSSQLSRTMRSAAGYVSSAGQTMSGGGSYSSSSSGSGGGGFSGGGGGGGGGGGR